VPLPVCELRFGGNNNGSAWRLRHKLNQLNCLHHYGLEVLKTLFRDPQPVFPTGDLGYRGLRSAGLGYRYTVWDIGTQADAATRPK
jgi:hypothetical protein